MQIDDSLVERLVDRLSLIAPTGITEIGSAPERAPGSCVAKPPLPKGTESLRFGNPAKHPRPTLPSRVTLRRRRIDAAKGILDFEGGGVEAVVCDAKIATNAP